ncbi:TetR/AcrR family transcriptional regulator [Frankia sp. AgKG'84/4]|uniref:TetR/AcrR family transcriptional regulator n=1 Tax=Frankia sp. AgKG'84/4 TaxID=573490 RepID=UPI0020100EE1|nr:TetR/AcrR family transcriptional regulator [Frankia sp. AgKG'84/4]MCL9795733.1 TetR/AcrR family transcriptional regulator [Frankia sp. AgKG'84/4]
MDETRASSEATSSRPLPPGLALLWGRRAAGARGPRPGLSVDAIVAAAIELADAEGLEAVSMARVAGALGFTTMSLYRHIASKDELLQLMWNGSALGVETLELRGETWRERLRCWALTQREMIDRHPWITQMPMAAPPLAPNSMTFVELGLAAFDDTTLPDIEKLRVIGLLSSYTLSEARMAHDAARAAAAAGAGAGAGAVDTDGPRAAPDGDHAGDGPGGFGPGGNGRAGNGRAGDSRAGDSRAGDAAGDQRSPSPPPWTWESLLRELIDVGRYPRLHALAWSNEIGDGPSGFDERDEFLLGVETILDGVAAMIARHAR